MHKINLFSLFKLLLYFLFLILLIIILPIYPIDIKLKKALGQGDNYTKFTTQSGGLLFKHNYPFLEISGETYNIQLYPVSKDLNNNYIFELFLYKNNQLYCRLARDQVAYFFGKLNERYFNYKYALIYIDTDKLYESRNILPCYNELYNAIFFLSISGNDRMFCDSSMYYRECATFQSTGYATNTPFAKYMYYDMYEYSKYDRYFVFTIKSKNYLTYVLASSPSSNSSPNQAATFQYLFSKLGYPHKTDSYGVYYDNIDLENELKNLNTKFIVFKSLDILNSFFIFGSNRGLLKPIFVQSPTSGSPSAMAATKEYVDKMCFGRGINFAFDPPPFKFFKFNTTNKGIHFKKSANEYAPLFVGKPEGEYSTKIFRDKVVNKYEVDKLCKSLEWNPSLFINSGYFKMNVQFTPPAPSHIPNSPSDSIYDLKNYKLYFYSRYGDVVTSTEIILPPTSSNIELWYPTIGRYSYFSAGINANYHSGHYASYATSTQGFILKPTPPPTISIKQIDIYLTNCANSRNYTKTFTNKNIPFVYSPTAEFGVPCYESRNSGVHWSTYCKMSVRIKFNVGPYPWDYINEFNYYRNNINNNVPSHVTSSIYWLSDNPPRYGTTWSLQDRKHYPPSASFETNNSSLDLWIDPTMFWPIDAEHYFWFRGDDFIRNPGCIKIGQGVKVKGDYSSMYYPDPSNPSIVRKSCVVEIGYFTGDEWPYFPGYGCAPLP